MRNDIKRNNVVKHENEIMDALLSVGIIVGGFLLLEIVVTLNNYGISSWLTLGVAFGLPIIIYNFNFVLKSIWTIFKITVVILVLNRVLTDMSTFPTFVICMLIYIALKKD